MDHVAQLVARLGVNAPDETKLARLEQLLALTQKWGRRIDLTSAREPGALAEILFVDALHLTREDVVPRGAHMVDVGAGVGAPTLPVCLMRDDVSAVLLEPRRKRVAFLRTVVGTFDLMERVRVIEDRVDPDAPEIAGGPFDVALSRATFAPDRWLDIGLRLAPRVLTLTGQQDPPGAPEGAPIVASHEYAVPSSGARRVITAYAR